MEARLTGADRNEILTYLGYRGGPIPPEVEADIGRCLDLLMETARPRVVWRRFLLDEDGALLGTDFRPAGEDVKTLLQGCEAVIFLAATLGAEAEALLRRAQVRNMTDAVILDACGSAAIENVCDNLCADLAAEAAPLHLTDRYSPGYGDFPFAQQRELCRLLNTHRRIGVTVTPGGLMLPQKTVTALLGLSPTPPIRRQQGHSHSFHSIVIRPPPLRRRTGSSRNSPSMRMTCRSQSI